MEQTIQLGKFNQLSVIKELDFGMYLDGYEEEILIPRVYIPAGTKVGDTLNVFLYRDSEDRLIATTLVPKAQVDEFAFLEVKQVSKLGVFLDWGLLKDLLVPFGEQHQKMVVGRKYLVRVYVDEKTNRIVASAKIERFLQAEMPTFDLGQAVQVMPYEFTDMAIKCLIEEQYLGILYRNETFKKITLGETYQAFIKKIREDKKIDLSLEQVGYERINNCKQIILDKLQQHEGSLPLNDKTEASVIYAYLEMSKKDFKKAVGGLLKEQKINMIDNCIKLL